MHSLGGVRPIFQASASLGAFEHAYLTGKPSPQEYTAGEWGVPMISTKNLYGCPSIKKKSHLNFIRMLD